MHTLGWKATPYRLSKVYMLAKPELSTTLCTGHMCAGQWKLVAQIEPS